MRRKSWLLRHRHSPVGATLGYIPDLPNCATALTRVTAKLHGDTVASIHNEIDLLPRKICHQIDPKAHYHSHPGPLQSDMSVWTKQKVCYIMSIVVSPMRSLPWTDGVNCMKNDENFAGGVHWLNFRKFPGVIQRDKCQKHF